MFSGEWPDREASHLGTVLVQVRIVLDAVEDKLKYLAWVRDREVWGAHNHSPRSLR